MIKGSFNYNDIDYEIHKYEPSMQGLLLEYCRQCETDGIYNNISFKHLKMGMFKNEAWWCVLEKKSHKIICLSGLHHCPEIEPGTYRIFFRTGTLKSYRGKAGPTSKLQKSCFAWGRLLPHLVENCLAFEAKNIVFTTNTSGEGTSTSNKQDKICHLVFEKYNMAKKINSMELFYTQQNIWKVIISNVYTMEKIIFND